MQVPTQKSGRFIMRIIEAMMMPVEKHMGEAELTSDIHAIKWLEMSWSCRHINQDSLVFFRAKKWSWLQHVLFLYTWTLLGSHTLSLLRRPSAGAIWMWIASIEWQHCLALSISVVSSHLMRWWSFQTCSLHGRSQQTSNELQEYGKQVVFKSG